MTTRGAVRNSKQGWLVIVSNDNIVKWVIWYVGPQRCDWIFSGARVYWRCKPKLLDTINRTRSSRRREVNSRLADTEQIDSGKQARGETETAKFS